MAINYAAPVKDLMFLFDDVMDMQDNFQRLALADAATPDILSAIFSDEMHYFGGAISAFKFELRWSHNNTDSL